MQTEIALDAPNRVFGFSADGRFLITEGESCPVFQLSYSPTPVERVLFVGNRNARTREIPTSSSFPEKETEPDWIVQPDTKVERPGFRVSSDARCVVVTYGTKIDVYEDGALRQQIPTPNGECHFESAFPSFDGTRILAYVSEHCYDAETEWWYREMSFFLYDQHGVTLCTEPVMQEGKPAHKDVTEISGSGSYVWRCVTPTDGSIICAVNSSEDNGSGMESVSRCFVFNPIGAVLRGDDAELLCQQRDYLPDELDRLSYSEPFDCFPSCLRVDNRRIALISASGTDEWSLDANTSISFAETSPNRQTIGFIAGTKIWVVRSDGSVVQTVRHKAQRVFPDDDGGFLALGRKPTLTRFSCSGEITGQIPLKGMWRSCERRNDLLALVTRYEEEDTLWVVNIQGEVVLRWTSCQTIAVTWAENRRFLVATSDLSITGLSVLPQSEPGGRPGS